jgi:His/Glu/Gln/Arg/opine family amino acid ABC transporter permease subunit
LLATILNVATRFWPLFLKGLQVTLLYSAATVFFGTILGAVICFLRMAKIKLLRFVATAYIEIIRGTPLLLQLYFFYFGLPKMLGMDIHQNVSILLALIINSSGYVAEIIRSGIQAVDSGQTEAARSLGLNGSQTMLKIVLPQAVKNILPSLANEFVMVIKETSLVSTFFGGDLMSQYKTISGALYLTIEPLVLVGMIYFVVTFTLSKLVALYERRLAASD